MTNCTNRISIVGNYTWSIPQSLYTHQILFDIKKLSSESAVFFSLGVERLDLPYTLVVEWLDSPTLVDDLTGGFTTLHFLFTKWLEMISFQRDFAIFSCYSSFQFVNSILPIWILISRLMTFISFHSLLR